MIELRELCCRYRKRHKQVDAEVLKSWAWQILCGLVSLSLLLREVGPDPCAQGLLEVQASLLPFLYVGHIDSLTVGILLPNACWEAQHICSFVPSLQPNLGES